MKKLLLTLSTLLVASATTMMAHADDVKGDAKAGGQKNAMCIGCHGIPGYQATFPEVYRVPMISGQGAKYIANALSAYRSGERHHPTMRGIAQSLSDQDIADLAAYYEQSGKDLPATTQSADAAPAKVAELVTEGGCVACHGEGFAKPTTPDFPKVAGQPSSYIYVALKSYKSENHATWGRGNAIMGGVAKQFSNDELKALAGYISTLPSDLKTVPQSRFR